jgi:hypothetical protein
MIISGFTRWFGYRSRAVRFFLTGFFIPVLWTALLGLPGFLIGIERSDSAGSILVGLAALVHLPTIAVLGGMGWYPIGVGDDSGVPEILLLAIVIIPSCLLYGFTAWLIVRAMEMKERN